MIHRNRLVPDIINQLAPALYQLALASHIHITAPQRPSRACALMRVDCILYSLVHSTQNPNDFSSLRY